jgi:hypothetical protein
MTKRILHVSIHPSDEAPDQEALHRLMDRAPDWVEYAPNRWLLWASLDSTTWYRRFRRVVGKDDSILIFLGDFSEYEGFLSTTVWKRLRKHRPITSESADNPTDEVVK